MIDKHHRFFLVVLAIFFSGAAMPLSAVQPRPAPSDLDRSFQAPPDQAKPWAYWWWVNGNVDEPTITRDLEQMKRKGFTGLLMFDSRNYHDDHLPPPPPRIDFMSPEWRRLLRFAMAEAGRLGLQVSVNMSDSAGKLGGPWDVGDDAPKQLLWASLDLGAGRFEGEVPPVAGPRPCEIALLAVRCEDTGDARRVAQVIDLTGKTEGGRLAWDVPSGKWTLLRFAYGLMEGHTKDVDILDPQAVERHFDRMGRTLIADAGPLAGKTLSHFYSVSWEGATPTWTRDFEAYFKRYRGYAMRPWLPVLAGLTVKSRELSDRFLADYNKTLGDCFMHHCYGTLQKLCNQAGLQWHSESGGPWKRDLPSFKNADQLAFLGRNDMPQGEFWYPERGLNRPIAMAAHIYGRPLAAAEAFTHMRDHWSVYPALLKPCADAAFCDGVNHLIWHTFTASPAEFGKPGIEYFAGSHLNPNVTWFEQSGAFLKYLARCQLMLRQGQAAVDVCAYVGDRPYIGWGRGLKWNDKPTLTLPSGYTFDLINTEVLLERLRVKDGRLVLPDGMSYRMLVLDPADETIPPAALRKIAELTRAGATVVLGRRPLRAPGLTDYPACDDQVSRLVSEVWGAPGAAAGAQTFGQGTLLRGMAMEAALKAQSLPPDFAGPWPYVHRRDGDFDLYFVSGAGTAECTFRVRGREPELWDPVTGRVRDAVCYRETPDGCTVVPLTLPENGSLFVVFRRPAESRRLASLDTLGAAAEIEGRTPNGLALRAWRGGSQALAGPWQVSFAPEWGAPPSAVFERLIAWNKHPDEGIKYFSGTATYRHTFALNADQAAGLVRLDLGKVGHVAEVRLNGRPLGVVWTAPWQVDLTGTVKPGDNTLEIDVTNLWVNRLIGDARLPEARRLTRTIARRPPDATGPRAYLKGYKADDPLAPSGLIGPVRLEFGTRIEQSLPAAP